MPPSPPPPPSHTGQAARGRRVERVADEQARQAQRGWRPGAHPPGHRELRGDRGAPGGAATRRRGLRATLAIQSCRRAVLEIGRFIRSESVVGRVGGQFPLSIDSLASGCGEAVRARPAAAGPVGQRGAGDAAPVPEGGARGRSGDAAVAAASHDAGQPLALTVATAAHAARAALAAAASAAACAAPALRRVAGQQSAVGVVTGRPRPACGRDGSAATRLRVGRGQPRKPRRPRAAGYRRTMRRVRVCVYVLRCECV